MLRFVDHFFVIFTTFWHHQTFCNAYEIYFVEYINFRAISWDKVALTPFFKFFFMFCVFFSPSLLTQASLFKFAEAIWPVTGQGFQNTKWPAVLSFLQISQIEKNSKSKLSYVRQEKSSDSETLYRSHVWHLVCAGVRKWTFFRSTRPSRFSKH